MCCYFLKQVKLHSLFNHRKSYSHHHDLVRSHRWSVICTISHIHYPVLVCDIMWKICQWVATDRWCSSGTSVSFTNKTDHHDIAEILLKVALNTITITRLWLTIGVLNKGNNKITELRTILQRKVKTHNYINRQNQSTTGKLWKP